MSLETFGKYQFIRDTPKEELNSKPLSGLIGALLYKKDLKLEVLKLLWMIMMCMWKDSFQTMESSTKQGLYTVLDRCRQRNLKLNREKCHFRVSKVCYVGHMLSAAGVKPDSQEDEAINTMPILTNPEDLQRFLGVVS